MLLLLELRKIGYSKLLTFDNLLIFLDLDKFGSKPLLLLITLLLLALIAIEVNTLDYSVVFNITIDRTIIMLEL